MKKILLVFILAFASCNKASETKITNPTEQPTQRTTAMNIVSIAEIPVTNFPKAVAFYENLLDIKIEEVPMGETVMGVFPSSENTVNLALVKGSEYKPTADGAVLYLNAGENLQTTLDKVEKLGGKVLLPKTEISPEMGYFALFLDTEGNKLGLHSPK